MPAFCATLSDPLTAPPLCVNVILNLLWVGPRPDLRLMHADEIWTDPWQIVAINDSPQRPQSVSQMARSAPRTHSLHASFGMFVQPLPSARAYHPEAASVPPSTGIVCPVTNRASSEARNSTTAA
jgi:hypothetical protein